MRHEMSYVWQEFIDHSIIGRKQNKIKARKRAIFNKHQRSDDVNFWRVDREPLCLLMVCFPYSRENGSLRLISWVWQLIWESAYVEHFRCGHELPGDGSAQCAHVDALGDVDRLRDGGDILQRPLYAVEDRVHDARAELDRQRLARAQHRVTNRHRSCNRSTATPAVIDMCANFAANLHRYATYHAYNYYFWIHQLDPQNQSSVQIDQSSLKYIPNKLDMSCRNHDH